MLLNKMRFSKLETMLLKMEAVRSLVQNDINSTINFKCELSHYLYYKIRDQNIENLGWDLTRSLKNMVYNVKS